MDCGKSTYREVELDEKVFGLLDRYSEVNARNIGDYCCHFPYYRCHSFPTTVVIPKDRAFAFSRFCDYPILGIQ